MAALLLAVVGRPLVVVGHLRGVAGRPLGAVDHLLEAARRLEVVVADRP